MVFDEVVTIAFNVQYIWVFYILQLEAGDGYTTLPPTQAPINPPYKTAKALKQKDMQGKNPERILEGAVAMAADENTSSVDQQSSSNVDEINTTDAHS